MIPGCSFSSTKGHSPRSLWVRQLHQLPDPSPSHSWTLCSHQRWELSCCGDFSVELEGFWGWSHWRLLEKTSALQGWTFFGGFPCSEDAGSSCWRNHSFTQPSYPGPGSHCLVWIRVLSSFFTPQKIKDNTDTNNTNPPLWEWAAGGIMPEKGSVKWLG